MKRGIKIDPAGKLSALYYPYSRCVDLEALKLLAILYEEIVFVDPLEELFREFLISSDEGCQYVPESVRQRWNENQEAWKLLHDAGIIRIIDPSPIIKDYDQLLTAAYAADMADEQFAKAASPEENTLGPWKMLESRIPPTLNRSFQRREKGMATRISTKEFWPGGYSYLAGGLLPAGADSDYQVGVHAWENYNEFGFREYVLEKLGGRKAPEVISKELTERVRKAVDASPLNAYEQLLLSGAGKEYGPRNSTYDYVDNVSFSTGEPIRILSFSQGASLSISQALIIADLQRLTPVTDNALHQELLSLKYQRALSNLSLTERSNIPRRSIEQLERYAIIARAVLMEALSPSFLKLLSPDQVLRFRKENQKSLERFWGKLRELSHELDDVPIGPGFDAKLIKLIDRAVVPELQSVAQGLENSRRKMYGSLISKMAAAVPASTTLSLFTGMTGAQLLALSIGAAISAFGLSLPSIIDYWQEKAKVGQSWLSLVLDLYRIAPSQKN
jgi:hypothetical protein